MDPGPSMLPELFSPSVVSLTLHFIVVVRFKSIGSAPIMKNNVFKATAGHKFQAVIMFLRQQLGMKKEDSLVSQP